MLSEMRVQTLGDVEGVEGTGVAGARDLIEGDSSS